MKNINEAITTDSELVAKLHSLPETEIFDFMQNLKGGTYFNMGMYSTIPVQRAYKHTIRIYKVLDLTAIVSGVSYENIGATKDFRAATGDAPGGAWYDHMAGYENKIGVNKKNPDSKYVLWDIKQGSNTCVRYYVVDLDTKKVIPVTKQDILNSDYLTPSEKDKLMPRPVTGFDLTTGALVENKTKWRTASFDHIFWLSQDGKNPKSYGTRFTEAIQEDLGGAELFYDAHAGIDSDLDAIISGQYREAVKEGLNRAGHITRRQTEKSKGLPGVQYLDNELFLDFE